MSTKRVETKVSRRDLTQTQGGAWIGSADGGLVWVECPVSYDLAKITAADIVHDDAIVVVRSMSHMCGGEL